MNKLFIKKGEEIRNINLDEVYFFTIIGNKTYAILKNAKIEVSASLNYLSGLLSENFLRSHKSFILNTY